jgi:ABC-type branched-subunit amino acid transport system permease subunit
LTLDLFPVFDLTYGQWLVALVALMYVPTLAASLCAFMLSRFSRNLITLVMKLLPVVVVFVYLRPVLFGGFFSLTRSQAYNILHLPGAEAYASFAILLIALAAALFVVRRERRVDVM